MSAEAGHILLVDDDKAVRESLRALLEGRGATVHEASDGRAAFAFLGSHPGLITVVVTDIVMPDVEGLALIRMIRRDFSGIRIIAMSGGGLIEGREYLQAAEHFGAHRTLLKPFAPEDLLRALDGLCE
jgi:CheY-like chemotaxis protein